MSKQKPQQRIVVNDEKERAQLEKSRSEMLQQEMKRQEMLKRMTPAQQKAWKKEMKKYELLRFSNWMLWITMVLVVVVGVYVYVNFLYLGSDYWGKEDGYSRVADRPALKKSAFDNVNNALKDSSGRSAKFEQKGPVVNLLVTVPEGTPVDGAKQFTEEAINQFLGELGDAKSEKLPYGTTFSKYELSIIITQKNLAKPDDAALNQIGNPSGAATKISYPFFGTVSKGVMTWTNNVA